MAAEFGSSRGERSRSTSPDDGIGKPEPLKHGLADYWTRRIDTEHRLVYKVEDDAVLIAQCTQHY